MYMEYPLKNSAILSFVVTWMNLEGIMLSELSQIKKDKCMISLINKSKNENKTKKSCRKRRRDLWF